MHRRSPPYRATDDDLRLIAASGRTTADAASLTGLSLRTVQDRAKAAGIKFVRRQKPSDTGRHGLVIERYLKGYDARMIAGEAEITTTQVYGHLRRARLKGEIRGDLRRKDRADARPTEEAGIEFMAAAE